MLTPVPTTDLYKHWEWVRAGLLDAKRKARSRLIPEDAYVLLRNGTGFLYLIADKGFCILQQNRDHDGLCLHVAWLWCPGLEEIKEEFCMALDELARKCGAIRIRGESPRGGFGLVGYMTEVSRTFEREL